MDRIAALAALVPGGVLPVVDVGADHGRLAASIGAIATERAPRRRAGHGGRWVIADGLTPFRQVGVAVVAGMGWRSIARILAGPVAPRFAVVHADDDPPAMRRWLAENGWRIDAERLAGRRGRFAELIRAIPGTEPATDLWLELGPALLRSADPLLGEHLAARLAHWRRIARETATAAPAVAEEAERRTGFLAERLRLWHGDGGHTL